MSEPPRPPLTMQQRRVRIIMTTLPIMVVTGYVLYKRLVLGEPQRTFTRPENVQGDVAKQDMKQ
ncbi:hypothetical protein VKT23_015199 [Stygiomarasmius scandens]|uniref:Uncharacterized protein n=1 Tax=Marasmiellus scandens TaxID=2682957 RepID=A0ABR1J1M5_9AGAR